MPKFMKMLNNISRSQAIYRNNHITTADLQSGHYAYVLTICRRPGSSQDEIAAELCVNKSTVTRNLNYLEENGYISRHSLPNDKRQFSVHPTEKMLSILPAIKKVSIEWMDLLSEGIEEGELAVFNSVLERMQEKARAMIDQEEESK